MIGYRSGVRKGLLADQKAIQLKSTSPLHLPLVFATAGFIFFISDILLVFLDCK